MRSTIWSTIWPTIWPTIWIVALAAVLGACGASKDDGAAQAEAVAITAPTTEAPTTAAPETTAAVETTEAVADPELIEPVIYNGDFSQSIQPILTESCASCHNSGGPGSAHFVIDNAGDAVANAIIIRAAINEGVMPPWPASDLSEPFHDDRGLRDDQIQAVLDWYDDDAAIDVDPSEPIIATALVALAEIDTEMTPVDPYDGSPARTDDYRCVVYDPQITEPTLLTGYNFVPDQTEIVHHAIGWRATSDLRAAADQLSAEDPGGGWQCFGGSGIGTEERLVAWAPGQDPTEYPDGTGLMLEPGDFIVMQIHYHYEFDAPADNSRIQLDLEPFDSDFSPITVSQYVAPAEIPCSSSESGPLCDRDAAAARAIERYGNRGFQAPFINSLCGVTPEDFAHFTDGVASSSCDLPIYGFGEIISVLGHEHEIGKSFRMTLNPDTPDERILLDIPVWSFEWQYNYRPVDSIMLTPGDTVRLECSWDRALRDPDLEPAYVLWADGTDDEMCFATIVTTLS